MCSGCGQGGNCAAGKENSEPLGLLEERDKIIELSGNGPEAAAR